MFNSLETYKSESSQGIFFISHILFDYAVNYSEKAEKTPNAEKSPNPQSLASVLFSYFSLEALIHEYIIQKSLIPNNERLSEKSRSYDKLIHCFH